MNLLHILILAVIQGAAELLPVSSSAHVIVAEKLMGLDPTRPEMTLLLVMLHTGTMFAVIAYFWRSWRSSFFSSRREFARVIVQLALATALTGAIGLAFKAVIEKVFLKGTEKAEIEMIFGNLPLISAALAVAGILIIVAGLKAQRRHRHGMPLDLSASLWMGAVQGLCLPFRGFSRSGATISVGLLRGVSRKRVEDFSFALAVVLTPPVIAREVLRLLQATRDAGIAPDLANLFLPSLAGMVFAFLAGLLALKWLSAWLERGRWHLFGIYCLCASLAVFVLSWSGM